MCTNPSTLGQLELYVIADRWRELTKISGVRSWAALHRSMNLAERSLIPSRETLFMTLVLAYRSARTLFRFACCMVDQSKWTVYERVEDGTHIRLVQCSKHGPGPSQIEVDTW